MSQLNIYKASAGSGKTYRLVLEYLKLLVENPFNYKHILAVTFTNKATTEMKDRILRELNKVAIEDSGSMIEKLLEETSIPQQKIIERAKLALANILHDYDRFAISTIDSFFQRILRSFARESGLYGTYEIDLDQDAILEEAIDRLLLSVEDDLELRNWLLTMSEDQLGEGKNWRINDKIQELGKELYKESFQKYLMLKQTPEVERAKLKDLKSELSKTRSIFEKECQRLGKCGLGLVEKQGLTILDFKYKASSFVNAFNKLSAYKGGKLELGVRFEQAIDNIDVWFSDKSKAGEMNSLYEGGFNELLHEVKNYLNSHIAEYNTAVELQKYIYSLGVLSTLNAKIREIGQENNSLLLSEGNLLLKGIIDDNDAPFVYEKAGTYYNYFMIDEFQDTSNTQWDNLRPLVGNSLSENHQNLVVGDVKQSIYRWRNSDWQLLNKYLKEDFKSHPVNEIALDSNWRSSKKIVEFNNLFFEYGMVALQEKYNQDATDDSFAQHYSTTILDAYADVEQNPMSSNDGGYINCALIAEADSSDYEKGTLEQVVKAVKDSQDAGFNAGDIAILVKKNSQGKKIAEALLGAKSTHKNYNFEVISDDTLYIDSSASVRFLTGVMKYVLTPADAVVKAAIVYEYSTNILPELERLGKLPKRFASVGQQAFNFDIQDESTGIISKQVEEEYFPFFVNEEAKSAVQAWSYKSLEDLVDELIGRYHLGVLIGDQANIQAFKDVVNDFSKRESGNLHKFVEWWKQFGDKVKLQSAGERDAIKIMTIHKSKGLEFPVVILPFCDWQLAPDAKKSNIIWCSTEHSKFQQFPILPAKFTSNLKVSNFSEEYYTEMLLSFIDNLNVLYVAQTRAVEGLYLISKEVKKPKTNTIADMLTTVFQNELISIDFEQEGNEYSFGKLKKEQIDKTVTSEEVNLSGKGALNTSIGDSLKLRRNYIDFLDDTESNKAAQINEGKLFHDILSYIESVEDIESAVDKLVFEGRIEKNNKESYLSNVIELLSKNEAASWFDGDGQVLNETNIILPSGDLKRPDRIMKKDGKIIIVDYKSTDQKSSSHQRQVSEYVSVVQSMGYQEVEGYVWYLKSNEILNVRTDY